MNLNTRIADCTLCAERFAATATRHSPRPVVWFAAQARILIAGQAPGARVHATGRPFTDRSGDRLREWLGLNTDTFYDLSRIAIVPMAFCFPGYDAKGSDLPPPAICAKTWRSAVLAQLAPQLTVLVGGHAQNWHMQDKLSVSARVERWRDDAPHVFCLPHPSWRNTAWLGRNPWFETELLPALRARVQQVLA